MACIITLKNSDKFTTVRKSLRTKKKNNITNKLQIYIKEWLPKYNKTLIGKPNENKYKF